MKTNDLLKSSFVQAVFRLTGKSFLPIVVLNLVMLIIFCFIFFILFSAVFGLGANVIEDLVSGNLAQSISMAILSSMTGLANRAMVVIVVLLFYLFTTWYYNFSFHIVDEYFRNNRLDLMSSFKNSFSLRLLKTFILALILLIVFIIVVTIASFLGAAFFEIGDGFGFTFVGILSSMVLMFFMRFMLVYPKALLTDQNIFKCFTESFQKIDFTLAIKYFLVTVILFILYGLISYGNSYISTLFISYGNLFVAIFFILNLILSSIVTAFLVSITLGIYYNHNPLQVEEIQLDLEENMIL